MEGQAPKIFQVIFQTHSLESVHLEMKVSRRGDVTQWKDSTPSVATRGKATQLGNSASVFVGEN